MKIVHNIDQLHNPLDRKNLHEFDPKKCLEVLRSQFENLFASKKVNALNYDNQHFQNYFKENMGIEPQAYRKKLLYEMDGLGKIIDEQIKKEMVTKGIALDVSLVYRECTDGNTTLSEQKDKSSSSGYDVDEEKLLVDTVASDIKNADIEPSYDTDTKVHHSNNDTFKIVFSNEIQSHEQRDSISDTYVVNENNSNIIYDIPDMDSNRDKKLMIM
ncbi:hypothetical protein Tco_1300122 [Tanacetum coccineum]